MDILKQRLSPNIYDKLIQANIDSPKVILMHDELVLSQFIKLGLKDVKNILQEAAQIVLENKLKPAVEVPEWLRLSTGCNTVDAITGGGLPTKGISEIVGPSGAGKTQLCLQLALMAQLPTASRGLGKAVFYICTEDVFPSKRLNQLARTFPLRSSNLQYEENVFVEHISDYEQLRRCLCVRLPKLLLRRNVGLIIVDSIAGVFRSENNGVNYTSRSHEFLVIASQLNKLGREHDAVVVCTNQVSDNTETGKLEPCLGLSWSNLVTCRFAVSRWTDTARLFEVVFASDLPSSSCHFFISNMGLSGLL